jgi:hypothetical protein
MASSVEALLARSTSTFPSTSYWKRIDVHHWNYYTAEGYTDISAIETRENEYYVLIISLTSW